MTCNHAAGGCNYPEGECSGACVKNNPRPRHAALEALHMGKTIKEIWPHDSGVEIVFTDDTTLVMAPPGATTPALASVLDVQEGGDHYKKLGAYQPWEVLRHWLTPEEFRGFMKGTAIAYLAREKDKGGMLDIKKAGHTLQGLVELLEQ